LTFPLFFLCSPSPLLHSWWSAKDLTRQSVRLAAMSLSSLTIRQLEFPYTIPEKNLEGITLDAEFFIDGNSLAEQFGISNRPWHGRTGFLGNEESVQRFIRALLGEAEPSNQLGTKRLVLYRCHCGSDYCGVISCEIVREQTQIHWLDIREESDDQEVLTNVRLEKLSFDLEQYQEAITSYLNSQTT
jgi:hypothetical protein